MNSVGVAVEEGCEWSDRIDTSQVEKWREEKASGWANAGHFLCDTE